MKNKYIVVKSDGKEVAPSDYLKSKACSNEMKVLIEREALNISARKKFSQPEYLKVANKFGFNWEPNSDIGFIQYGHKADLMRRLVGEYARQLVNNIGFPIYEIRGSNFFDLKHPIVQAYAGLFGERLFKYKNKDSEMVMSYDSSYPHFNLAKSYNLSHKNLPFAHFSLADCYRYEQSGECMLLFRGRRFFMSDLHPYFKDIDEAFEWYFKIEEMLDGSFANSNRKYVNLVKVSSDKNWEIYRDKIKKIAKNGKKDILIEVRLDGEDRYWIIDVDYSFIDKLNQPREIGCIQIDVGNAQRLGICYKNSSGEKKYPVIIHSAVPGGIERFLYMSLDDYPNSLPLWLSPVHIRIIPVGKKYVKVAEKLARKYSDRIRIEVDDKDESVSRRVKRSHEDLVPVHLVLGEKENRSLMKVEKQLSQMAKDNSKFPFLRMNWPILVSNQVR